MTERPKFSADQVTISRAEYDALLDERRHWRETAAVMLLGLTGRIDRGDHRLALEGPKVPRSVVMQQAKAWTEMLSDAVSGSFYPVCESCEKPVRPGDICFPWEEVTAHADCDHPRPGKHQAGETMHLADAGWLDEDGVPRSGPVDAVLFAHRPLFTDDEIFQLLTQARDLCGIKQPAAAPAEGA